MARSKQTKPSKMVGGPSKSPRRKTIQKPQARAAGRGGDGAPPTKRRYRPGMRALKEIRQFQKSTELLIRKLPFARLVSPMCHYTAVHAHFKRPTFPGQRNHVKLHEQAISVASQCFTCVARICRSPLSSSLRRRVSIVCAFPTTIH